MISERISDDIPPQSKGLNMVIPMPMPFCSFVSNWNIKSGIKPHTIQRNDVINDIKQFPTVYCRIYSEPL